MILPACDAYEVLDLAPYFNNDGISSDANRADGDLTGAGNTYPEEDLPPSNGWVECEGTIFRFPDKGDGLRNNISLEGQCISVRPDRYDALCLLGASSEASLEDAVGFSFTDGSRAEGMLGLSSWRSGRCLRYGEHTAIRCFGYHFPSQHVYTDKLDVEYGIWMQRVAIDGGRRLRVMEFPDNPSMHVFAMTLHRIPRQMVAEVGA